MNCGLPKGSLGGVSIFELVKTNAAFFSCMRPILSHINNIFNGGHKTYKYEGHPAPAGPALTNDLCGQNVKSQSQKRIGFDFNILTAFIRLGRARPAGAGCPP